MRGAAARSRWEDQPRDRRPARSQRTHRRPPSAEHLRQAWPIVSCGCHGPGGTTEPGVPVATVCLVASGVGLVPAVLGAAAWQGGLPFRRACRVPVRPRGDGLWSLHGGALAGGTGPVVLSG